MMSYHRRIVLVVGIVVALMLAALPAGINAASYPSKPIELIAPVAPGGSTDTLARLVSKVAAKYIDQPIVVVNKPGGSEIIGREYVAHSKPDGYTLVIGYGSGADVVSPHRMKMPYNPLTAFEPICMLSAHPYVLVVPSSSPYKTLEDLVAGAKKKGSITMAVAIKGSLSDLATQVIARSLGIHAVPIGFSGGAEAVTNTVGGQVDAGLAHPSEVLPHIKAGRLRPLALSIKQRISDLPDVPTLFEKGCDIAEFAAIKGIAAPKGTPAEVIKYLEEKFKQISKDPEFVQGMQKVAQPIIWMGASDFKKFVLKTHDDYGKYMKELGFIK